MLVLDLDPLTSTLVRLPDTIVTSVASVGVHLDGSWVAGSKALAYGYLRGRDAWRSFFEDPADVATSSGVTSLMRPLVAGAGGEEVCVVLADGAAERLVAMVGSALGRRGPHCWSSEFWCAALGLPAGRYAFVRGGHRSGRMLPVQWTGESTRPLGSGKRLPAWGRGAWQAALEPVARSAVLDQARVEPLAAPVLARQFYGSLDQMLSEPRDAGGWSLGWDGRRITLPADQVGPAVEQLHLRAAEELGRVVRDAEVQFDGVVALPSAQRSGLGDIVPPHGPRPVAARLEALPSDVTERVRPVLRRSWPKLDGHVRRAANGRDRRPSRVLTVAAGVGLIGVAALVVDRVWQGKSGPSPFPPDQREADTLDRQPGLYTRAAVGRGSRLSADQIRRVGAGESPPVDRPTEPWHVENAYVLRDLPAGAMLQWRDLAADGPTTSPSGR